MPNHVSSHLIITGPSADVHRFVNQAKTDKCDFDFQGIVPMPDDLRGTTSPTRIQTQEEIDTVWAEWNKKKADGKLTEWQAKDDKPWALGITREAYDALVAKYGASNWYEWANQNWGTKWGAYDASEWEIVEGENGNATAAIFYNTAWSPATPFYCKAGALFPTLTFDTQYADEGGGFVSATSYADGDVIEDTDFEWDSDDGIRIRELVGCYYPEDEEDDVDEVVAE